MSIQELGSLGELIAAIATVATLVYLAIQINQNTRAVKASVLETTGSRSSDLAKFVTNGPELSRILMTTMTSSLSEFPDCPFQLISMFLCRVGHCHTICLEVPLFAKT